MEDRKSGGCDEMAKDQVIRTMMQKGKQYYLKEKKDSAGSGGNIITTESAHVNYWKYMYTSGNEAVKGTPYRLISSIPRIAGIDFYVDNCGDVVSKTINVPEGEFVRVHEALAINPQTGECLLNENYVLVENE